MKKLTAVLVILFATSIQAQKFELGKVSVAELQEKIHPKDSSAVAAILYDNGKTSFEYDEQNGFVIVTEVKTRIKIYTKAGYEWANKTLQYYSGDSGTKDKVSFSDAATYNLVDGKIVKTKLKSDGEFNEKINKYWSHKKITLPDIKEGSVIEYAYTVRSPRISTLSDWEFQTNIPVNYSEYATYIPEYLIYNIRMKGYIQPKIANSSQNRSMTINYTTKEVPGMSTGMPTHNSQEIQFKENITKYSLQDVPALKEEQYVNNVGNYTASVQHELSMTQYPNAPIKSFSMTWDDLVKTIYDSDDFGSELKKTGYFEDDIKTITAGLTTKEEKVAAIFNYVKNRMNWNDFTGYSCDDGVKKAYKDKVGNIAEINLMLTAMLRYAGISANPVLVSTRSNGISYFPNRTAYNYVICAVESDNDVILLDATDKFSLPNILPVRALNWTGRIVRENGSSASVDLMPKNNSKDVVNLIASIDADGKFNGKVRDQYFDYNAFIYRENFKTIAKDSYLEKLEKRYNGLEIGEYAATSDDFSKPVTENYAFTHGNVSEVIADKIYFPAFLFFTSKENPFKQDKREYPVDFVFPNQDKYAFTITIPDGYAVESMPAPIALSMENNLGSFMFNITSSGKQIQIVASVDINQSVIGPEDYETLKIFYKTFLEKENEKIVLKKI